MRGFGLIMYFVFIITITVLGVFFAKQNAEPVIVQFFYLRSVPTAQWVVILIAFLLGFLTSTLLLSWNLIKVYISKKKYMHSYEELKSSLEQKIKDFKIDGQE